MGIIEIRNLHYSYEKTRTVLSGVNICVEKGEKLALLGLNGSGKSTLIKILSGILYYKQGTVQVMGIEVKKRRPALSKKFGYVSGQKTSLWEDFTFADCISIFGKAFLMKQEEIKKRISEINEYLSILQLLPKQIKKMSFGERMKADISCALLNYPEVLILDEPFVGLDFISKHGIIELLNDENKCHGTTIFFTSHDIQEVSQLANRIVFLKDGEVAKGVELKSLVKAANGILIKVKLKDNCTMPKDLLNLHALGIETNYLKKEIIFKGKNLHETVSFLERMEVLEYVVDISFGKEDVNKQIEMLLGGEIAKV